MRSRLTLLSALLFFATAAAPACSSKDDEGGASGVVIVGAPEAGVVRRVLVNEGARVDKGDAVVEIVVSSQGGAAPTPRAEDPVAVAGRSIAESQAAVEAARADVVKAEVEVSRLTPLVASGQASRGELDGARATYESAQQRLQRAQSGLQSAQAGLVAARQPNRNAATMPTPSERVVYATATSDGTLSVVTVRAGERVTAGQPLATLRSER